MCVESLDANLNLMRGVVVAFYQLFSNLKKKKRRCMSKDGEHTVKHLMKSPKLRTICMINHNFFKLEIIIHVLQLHTTLRHNQMFKP